MWAKVDDQWWMHPKVMPLPMNVRGLWVTALSYCAGFGSPFVPDSFVTSMLREEGAPSLVSQLEDAGLFVPVPGGWTIEPWHGVINDDERASIQWAEGPLLDRDGWSCANCKAGCAALQIDHIVPWSRGGRDTLDNFRWLCPPCNQHKRDQLDSEWEGRAEARVNDCALGMCGHEYSARLRRFGTTTPADATWGLRTMEPS